MGAPPAGTGGSSGASSAAVSRGSPSLYATRYVRAYRAAERDSRAVAARARACPRLPQSAIVLPQSAVARQSGI